MTTRVWSPAARVVTSRPVSSKAFSALTALEEFSGIPALFPTAKTSSVSSQSTLSSGLTIVTENASLTSTVSLTFPNAGSSNELPSESGAALANRYMAFKSGSGLSSALIIRSLEDVGATLFASAGRRAATIGYTATRENALFVAPLLATSSSFEKWDVNEAIDFATKEAEEASSNAQVCLTDQIYAAAYGGQSSMGRSYYTSGASRSSIISFRERAYTLNGAILAATGIADHEAFVRMVEEEFPSSSAGSPLEKVSSEYLGGEARFSAPSTGYCHLALAFKGPTSSTMINVLKHCLNMSGATAFAAPGIIGVYGGSSPGEAQATVDALTKAFESAPSADVVSKAKAVALAESLSALDRGSKSLADAMTASVLDSCGFSAKGLVDSYSAINADEVSKAFLAAKDSKLSFAAVGDITSVPYHATVASRFS